MEEVFRGGLFMKLYIRGFAEMQREIERNLTAHTDEIIEHLLKCYLMPEHSSVNHWKSEIANQIYKVDRLKNNKKFPSAKQIYKWTYDKKQDLITDVRWFTKYVGMICEEYSIDIDESPADFMGDFDRICVEYFTWLSNELSQIGLISKSEIYSKLNELL